VGAGDGALLVALGTAATVELMLLLLGGLATDATGVACELQPATINEARARAPKVIFFKESSSVTAKLLWGVTRGVGFTDSLGRRPGRRGLDRQTTAHQAPCARGASRAPSKA
jgi:hypothetical protein